MFWKNEKMLSRKKFLFIFPIKWNYNIWILNNRETDIKILHYSKTLLF